jgi:hypothetical protein
MPRSRIPIRAALAAALFVFALPLFAARPFHLTLEANAAAPFPFLSRFGTITLHVYPAGVRAETIWLNGFSKSGTPDIVVMNPLARMYTEVPVSNVASLVSKLSRVNVATGETLPMLAPVNGTVHGIAAQRYRIVFGPDAWIDVWTTQVLGDSPQYRAIVQQFVRGVSPVTANTAARIPGLPLYVELNFSHYKKLPIVKVKALSLDAKGQEDALQTGSFYMHAPLLDALWK